MRLRCNYGAGIAYVLVDDNAVGQDSSQLLCERGLPRAGCASEDRVRLCAAENIEYEPDADQDDLCLHPNRWR